MAASYNRRADVTIVDLIVPVSSSRMAAFGVCGTARAVARRRDDDECRRPWMRRVDDIHDPLMVSELGFEIGRAVDGEQRHVDARPGLDNVEMRDLLHIGRRSRIDPVVHAAGR